MGVAAEGGKKKIVSILRKYSGWGRHYSLVLNFIFLNTLIVIREQVREQVNGKPTLYGKIKTVF